MAFNDNVQALCLPKQAMDMESSGNKYREVTTWNKDLTKIEVKSLTSSDMTNCLESYPNETMDASMFCAGESNTVHVFQIMGFI